MNPSKDDDVHGRSDERLGSRHDRRTGQGGGLAETVSEQATKAKDQGRRELRDQLDERTTQLGHQARSSETLRRSGAEAKAQGPDEAGVERSRQVWRIGLSVRGATWSGLTVKRCFAMQSSSCGHGPGSWQGPRLRRGSPRASSRRRLSDAMTSRPAPARWRARRAPRPNASQTYERVPVGRQPVATGRRPERRTMSTEQANDLHDRPIVR